MEKVAQVAAGVEEQESRNEYEGTFHWWCKNWTALAETRYGAGVLCYQK